jgi:hypothetical protein
VGRRVRGDGAEGKTNNRKDWGCGGRRREGMWIQGWGSGKKE